MEADEIQITDTNDRGFHQYGEPLICTYGNTARVVESSAASGPHVWLFAETPPTSRLRRDLAPGECSLHLNEEQARGLIARLQAWVDEIPERWDLSEREGEDGA
jgi:hypothetical protein